MSIDVSNQERLKRARIATLAWLIETGAIRDKNNKPVACVMDSWKVSAKGAFEDDATPERRVKFKGCGSAMCIGGSASFLFGNSPFEYDEVDAADALGLDLADAQELFYPHKRGGYKGTSDDWAKITPKRMARTLRRLARTGTIDWS